MKKKRKIINLIVIGISVCVCFFFSYRFFKKGLNNYIIDTIKYNRQSEIDYKVYLKENPYFSEAYLPKDKVYITSLIDYVDANFKYSMVLDQNRTGKFLYYLKGKVSANIENSDKDYWSKDIVLTEPKTGEIIDSNIIEINDNVKFSYDEYNELLMSFKDEYGISMDGFFTVYLEVITNFDNNYSDIPFEIKSLASMKMPLTTATIEIPIDVNASNDSGEISSDLVYLKDSKYLCYKCIGIALFIAGIVEIVYLTLYFVRMGEKEYAYQKKIKKILKTYDSIIVTSNNFPDLTGLNVISVAEFSELLDAHSEVRLPINYFDDQNKAVFLLMSDRVAWYYSIEKEMI